MEFQYIDHEMKETGMPLVRARSLSQAVGVGESRHDMTLGPCAAWSVQLVLF